MRLNRDYLRYHANKLINYDNCIWNNDIIHLILATDHLLSSRLCSSTTIQVSLGDFSMKILSLRLISIAPVVVSPSHLHFPLTTMTICFPYGMLMSVFLNEKPYSTPRALLRLRITSGITISSPPERWF